MSKGRSWVKLWVNEWLDGTTRFEMSGAQRAFWADLLAMAGRSRVPGFVCSGVLDGKVVGYPLSRYEGILNDPTVDVLESLKMFERREKIKLTVTREEEPKLYCVEILSWSKYQSEYMRQKASRYKSKHGLVTGNVTSENTKRCAIEGEVEGDVEVEEEKPTPSAASGFNSFWEEYPKKLDKAAAQRAWKKVKQGEVGAVMSGLASWRLHWTDQQFIPYAATWLNKRRWENVPQNDKKPQIGVGPQCKSQTKYDLYLKLKAEGKVKCSWEEWRTANMKSTPPAATR